MIHPDTDIQYIDQELGFGVFASKYIPCGTIVYVQDIFDIVIPADSPLLADPLFRKQIDKYSVIEPPANQRVLCWDSAKYINHCCQANTLSTGYGFEIAIRDIYPGEELRSDYGLYNLDWDIALQCQRGECRCRIRPIEIDGEIEKWDSQIRDALRKIPSVSQPLWHLLNDAIREGVCRYLEDERSYQSVRTLIIDKTPEFLT